MRKELFFTLELLEKKKRKTREKRKKEKRDEKKELEAWKFFIILVHLEASGALINDGLITLTLFVLLDRLKLEITFKIVNHLSLL
ncbi:hypothetical protein [Paenibacillus apiarius]|uniref:hypothetical protein n=1 Tax=Paenibacillus apiarius TaxID=46240 RepID=UPI003B3BE3F2